MKRKVGVVVGVLLLAFFALCGCGKLPINTEYVKPNEIKTVTTVETITSGLTSVSFGAIPLEGGGPSGQSDVKLVKGTNVDGYEVKKIVDVKAGDVVFVFTDDETTTYDVTSYSDFGSSIVVRTAKPLADGKNEYSIELYATNRTLIAKKTETSDEAVNPLEIEDLGKLYVDGYSAFFVTTERVLYEDREGGGGKSLRRLPRLQ